MYSSYRFKNREEDEEALRRQNYIEKLNKKKELIKSEFEKLQEEQKFDILTIKSDNNINFKNLLNELKATTTKKQEKLFNNEKIVFFSQSSYQQNLLPDYVKDNTSKLNITNSFLKSSYKNKIFDTASYRFENNVDFLKQKLQNMKNEIENIKDNIQNELINKTTRQNKLLEIETSKKKMLFEMNDLNFAKKMTFKKFDNLDTLLFNAQAKKKMSLFHLTQIKNEMMDLKNIENDFFKQKISIVQQEKFDIEKEQGELSKILVQIDNAKNKLSITEKELRELEYQEEKLNKQRLETFYIKEYINFFNEFHRLFTKGEIYLPNEENAEKQQNIIDIPNSPLTVSFHSSDLGKSPMNSPRLRARNTKKSIKKSIISPRKIIKETDMEERLSIVRSIFAFHQEYPNGLEEVIHNIKTVYNDLLIQSNSFRKQVQETSLAKTAKIKELELLVKEMDLLKEQNKDLLLETNLSSENNIDSTNYSVNSGILQNIYKHDIITVNQLKQEIMPIPLLTINEINHLKTNAQKNEKFIFSTSNNISLKILLLADMVFLISKIAEIDPPPDLKRLCDNIRKKLSYRKKPEPRKKNITSLHLNKFDENFEKLPFIIDVNEISYDDIAEEYFNVFGTNTDLKYLRQFYNLYKNDRVLSFFISIGMICHFFRMIKEKFPNSPKKIVEMINELKKKAYDLQNKKINENFQFFIQILHEIQNYKQFLKDNGANVENFGRVYDSFSNLQQINSFVNKKTKQQIEKIKILNNISSSSDPEEEHLKKNEASDYIKIDTIEQITTNNNGYKPSYYLSLQEEMGDQKNDQKTETEIFEEERAIIKKNIAGEKNSNDDSKKDLNIWENKSMKTSLKYKNDNGIYLRDMLKFSEKKNGIARMDQLSDKITESALEFHHQLKSQKEKTIYNLYHTDKGYNEKDLKKSKNFKITNKTNKSQQNTQNIQKNPNQTISTVFPTSRAQTSSYNKRKKPNLKNEYFLGEFTNMNYLNYDVLFNKTEEDKSDYSLGQLTNLYSHPSLTYGKLNGKNIK